MLSGKQKAQLLIKLLEDKSTQVLQVMDPNDSKQLTSSLDDIPTLEDTELVAFLDETLALINQARVSIGKPEEDNFADLDLPDEAEDIKLEDEEPKEEKAKYPENYRNIPTICAKLQEQQTQIIAFFLKHCDETLKEDIMYQLPDELKQKIAENPVDDMPISDRIYERIFNQIVIKTEDEQNDVEQTASDSFDF